MVKEGYQKGAKGIPVDSLNHFHAIIRPGDSVEKPQRGISNRDSLVRTNPILLLNREDMLPRGSLRKRMGIPEEAVLSSIGSRANKRYRVRDKKDSQIPIAA